MKIKLIKDATIHGIKSKSGKVHEVIDLVAQKLIDRGYAVLDDGKVVEPVEEEVEEDGTSSGIFDNETVPIDAGGYAPVHQEQPRFLCRTVDVPNIAYDDVLVINSATYYVRAWVDNGQGMIEIQLEKV